MCSEEKSAEPTTSQGVIVAKITYGGWTDSYELSNSQVRVVIVPAVGRIMHYGFRNGPNILWTNPQYSGITLPSGQPYRENGAVAWANFGGDKVWPTEQSKFAEINGWAWPPDHWFDGGRHEAEEIPGGVRIISGVSEFCGARCIREITLADSGTDLTIRQTIRKEKRARKSSVEPIEFTIWNVTQIRSPLAALFNLNPNSSLPDAIRFWSEEARANFYRRGSVGVFRPSPTASQKAGADSDLWLAAIVDNIVIAEFFRRQPGVHPDGDLSAEVYTSPQYTELELLSPLTKLSIGQEIHHDIVWRLYALPTTARTVEEKIEAAVGWLGGFR